MRGGSIGMEQHGCRLWKVENWLRPAYQWIDIGFIMVAIVVNILLQYGSNEKKPYYFSLEETQVNVYVLSTIG